MFESLVVLGDSFAEGLDDRRADGSYRGWADLTAAALADAAPGFTYANLAIRGKKLGHIRDEQLAAALDLRPDLVMLAGGGNDLLRPSVDVPALVAAFADIATQLVASGASVLLFAGFDPREGLPLSGRIRTRAHEYNEGVRGIARDLDTLLVDLWSLETLYQPHMWSVDRLHLSSAGHAFVAGEVLSSLGVEPARPLPAPEPAPHETWRRGLGADLQWGRQHLVPWLVRHARGRSSGDGVEPKAPLLAPPPHAEDDLAG